MALNTLKYHRIIQPQMAMQNGRFVYLKYRNFTSRVVDEPGAAHPTKPTPSKPPRPSLGKQTQQKLTHDYHAKHREIQADNSVYVKDVKRAKSWIPGTIIGRTGPVSAKVQLNLVRSYEDIKTTSEFVRIQIRPHKETVRIKISFPWRYLWFPVMDYLHKHYRTLHHSHPHHYNHQLVK